MAGGIGLPSRPDRPWRHDWYPYGEYQVVHGSYMDALRDEGIVLREALSFIETYDRRELLAVTLRGRLFCAGDVVMRIEKRMAVRRGAQRRYEVRTVAYQYHAWLRSRPDRPRRDLIRIDTNPHRPSVHAHLFDDSGREWASPDLGLEDMPTLDAFVRHVVAASAE